MSRAGQNILTAVVAIALAACGGGGGGGGVGNVNPPPPVTLVTITTVNAAGVAGAVLLAALEGGNLAALAVPDLSGDPVGAAKSAPLLAKIGEIRTAQVTSLLKQSQAGYMQVPFGPEVTPCTIAGSVTMTGDLADSLSLSNGDEITLDFTACDDGDGVVVDGAFTLTITSFSGDFVSGNFSLGVTIELTAFQVAEGGETLSANGDISVSISTLVNQMLSTTVSSSSLTITAGTASHTLGNFAVARSLNEITGEYTLTTSGSLGSSTFTGTANFSTTVPLVGVDGSYPAVGEVRITGANNARIRVIVLDATYVRLEVDTNGDGTNEAVIDTTWDALA